MTNLEFNKKYEHFIEGRGLAFNIESVANYLDELFVDLINVKGFMLMEVTTKHGLCYFESNLPDILFSIGRVMEDAIEERINFLIRVETEIENRNRK